MLHHYIISGAQGDALWVPIYRTTPHLTVRYGTVHAIPILNLHVLQRTNVRSFRN